MTSDTEKPKYIHGHHESVLRSHSWRTAENSAAYLLPHLKPDFRILDIGCGPGTITNDLATRVPDGSVIGLDTSEQVLENARKNALQKGVKNVEYQQGDVFSLPFRDGTFDIIHVHQVLQHLKDPVKALKEMKRVTKKGGLIGCREADIDAAFWYPEFPELNEWKKLFKQLAQSAGTYSDAGRQCHAWAHAAGFAKEDVTAAAGLWCFNRQEELHWWCGMWADRIVQSTWRDQAIDGNFATQEQLQELRRTWLKFRDEKDAWFTLPQGEVLCRV